MALSLIGGDHDDGEIDRLFLQLLEDKQSGTPWQHHVENKEIWLRFAHEMKPAESDRRGPRRGTFMAKRHLDGLQDVWVVIDDRDGAVGEAVGHDRMRVAASPREGMHC